MEFARNLSIAVTGASGAIGRSVCAALAASGHTVYPVRREPGNPSDARWDVATGHIEFPGPVDVLIHLAGRSVADRWSAQVKREIADSRGPAAQRLLAWLANQPASGRPKRILCASAIGIYGSRSDELLTEDSPLPPPGESFLADVCQAWEAAAQAAVGIPVTRIRIGVVLMGDAGALPKMVSAVRWGLASRIGDGRQFISWITLTDLVRLMEHLATMDTPPEVINAVAPNPVRQHEFLRTIGRIIHRPTLFPVPSSMVKLMFGQMGRETALASQRVTSNRIPAGWVFNDVVLEEALREASPPALSIRAPR